MLTPGTRLGPYEIQSLIGAGGMGQVYRARDTRLNRTVAVKVSHERFTDRFEAAAVNRGRSVEGRVTGSTTERSCNFRFSPGARAENFSGERSCR